jgi:predicted homoserine dehydrogenase-like protein
MEEEEEDEMEWEEGDGNNSKAHHDTSPKDVNNASSLLHQPTHLQKSDQDGHKVSFSIAAAAKRPKT